MAVIRVVVRAKPGASRTRVGGSYGPDGALVVAVTSPAVDGAANDAVIRAVAKATGLRARDVAIVSGHRSRAKILALDVADAEVEDVSANLAELRKA